MNEVWNRLIGLGKTIIGLHIRRGDFEDIHQNDFHLISAIQILTRWLREIWAAEEDPVLFLCSDAIEHIRPRFAEFNPITAVDLGAGLPLADFFIDFDLLCRCDIIGISNSTFSFVASMLNQRAKAFYRPTFDHRMERFDPWNAQVLLRRDEQPISAAGIAVEADEYARNPGDGLAATRLGASRKRAARAWLSTPAELFGPVATGELGAAQLHLLASALRETVPQPADEQLLATILDTIALGPAAGLFVQSALSGMLYRRGDELGLPVDLDHVPDTLLEIYLRCILFNPRLIRHTGELDAVCRYFAAWTAYLHQYVCGEKNQSERSQKVGRIFAECGKFVCMYFSTTNLRQFYAHRGELLERNARNLGHAIDHDFPPRPPERKRMRIGILAGSFTPQTETFHTLPTYEFLDPNLFEVILYTLRLAGHPLESYCRSRAQRMVHLTGELAGQVAAIRGDELDVLLIGSNTGAVNNEITSLALHRVARAQITLFSSPASSGIPNTDYFLSGRLSEPPDAQEHYRERLIEIDGPGFCFGYHAWNFPSTLRPTRAQWNIEETAVVLASGANYFKLIPETIDLWAQILAAVPRSLLVIYPFGPAWGDDYLPSPFLQNFSTRLVSAGVNANRLRVLSPIPSRADVMECLKLCDIYLDSPRHAGGHSLLDPLQVGLPSVSIEGPFLRSRHGAAMLRELGLTELIAHDESGYRQLAIALGTDPERRTRSRERVTAAMRQKPRFLDSKAFAAQMQRVFIQIATDRAS